MSLTRGFVLKEKTKFIPSQVILMFLPSTLHIMASVLKLAWILCMLPWNLGRKLFSEGFPHSSSRLQILTLAFKLIPLLLLEEIPYEFKFLRKITSNQESFLSESVWPKLICHKLLKQILLLLIALESVA